MYKLKIVELPKPLNIKTQINFPEVVLGKMQEKTIIPKTTFQEVLPDKNYDGLSKVNVEAVTNEIDENIKSENIKKDISILGVQGNIEELKGTKLEITKNGTYIPEEPYNAFTEVEANVEADVSDYFRDSMTYVGSTPALLKLIKTIPMVTITGTSCERMFQNSGITHLPLLDTSNITDMTDMLAHTQIKEIPAFDTSNVTKFGYFCAGDGSYTLTKVPLLNFSKAEEIHYMLTRNKGLTDLGGFQNLGQAYDTTKAENYVYYKLDLSYSTRLTHDSLMNVINNLYDIATKGVKTQQVVIGSTNISKLSAEEVAIGTSKGWSIS